MSVVSVEEITCGKFSVHWYICHSVMQGSNENIKKIIGIISILDYLDLIQICIAQNIPFGFKIFSITDLHHKLN